MGTLYLTVFEGASEVPLDPPLQEEPVTIGAGSLQSNPIAGSGKKKRRVRCAPDADCFVTWGENPTALADGTEGRAMSRNNIEYFDIEAGHRVAVIER